jgi:long-chain acyl-CoA synthetase
MTECSPVIASNTTISDKIFTVGKPFSSVEVKISDIGEICVRGGSVFGGYLNHEKLNPEEFFPTGDIGTLDSSGFLSVTGRIKEQCKNANGKFVNIVKIEGILNEISGVENSCVIAEGNPYTVAVLFTQRTDFEAILVEVSNANKNLEHWECVQYFHLTQEKPTVENNVVTPSMKLRRNDVMKKYSNEIDELYRKKRT